MSGSIESSIAPTHVREITASLMLSAVLFSGAAHAGVVYEFNYRSLTQPPSTPVSAQYIVQGDKIRIAPSDDRLVFIFKDHTIYVVDNALRPVIAQKHETLSEIAAILADSLKILQDSIATAPPEKREMFEQSARDMKEFNERQVRPVPHDFRKTDRSESVDGHRCRLWEERENGAKRLELYVASLTEVPGGAEILLGMKTLSEYWQGSTMALGVVYTPGPWWLGMETLGGVPILIREFKGEEKIGETMLTAAQVEVPSAALFDLPDGYSVQQQPMRRDP